MYVLHLTFAAHPCCILTLYVYTKGIVLLLLLLYDYIVSNTVLSVFAKKLLFYTGGRNVRTEIDDRPRYLRVARTTDEPRARHHWMTFQDQSEYICVTVMAAVAAA